jgi:hypothetical protein
MAHVRQKNERLLTRFCSHEPLTYRSFSDMDNQGNFRGFAWKWYEKNCIPTEQSLSNIVQRAADGIKVEGEILSESSAAEQLAHDLLEVKDSARKIIGVRCIKIYTQQICLYKSVNDALRADDQSKLETYGPFCYLLNYASLFCLNEDHLYEGVVYRGMNLAEREIEQYRNAVNDSQPKQWLGFTSTTKNYEVTKLFAGDTIICNKITGERVLFWD